MKYRVVIKQNTKKKCTIIIDKNVLIYLLYKLQSIVSF